MRQRFKRDIADGNAGQLSEITKRRCVGGGAGQPSPTRGEADSGALRLWRWFGVDQSPSWAKWWRSPSRATKGALMRQRGVFTTSAATAIVGASAGAKPTNQV